MYTAPFSEQHKSSNPPAQTCPQNQQVGNQVVQGAHSMVSKRMTIALRYIVLQALHHRQASQLEPNLCVHLSLPVHRVVTISTRRHKQHHHYQQPKSKVPQTPAFKHNMFLKTTDAYRPISTVQAYYRKLRDFPYVHVSLLYCTTKFKSASICILGKLPNLNISAFYS